MSATQSSLRLSSLPNCKLRPVRVAFVSSVHRRLLLSVLSSETDITVHNIFILVSRKVQISISGTDTKTEVHCTLEICKGNLSGDEKSTAGQHISIDSPLSRH